MSKTLFAFVIISCLPQLAATYLAGTRTVDAVVPHRNYAEVAPGIRLANGSLAYYQTDLQTEGRVLGLAMRRVWRSDMTFDGPFGQGWTCTYTQAGWKDSATNDIHWHDADGFLHTFHNSGGVWVSPPGVYARAGYDNGVRLRMRDGSRLEFNAGGQLTAIVDRNGNDVTLAYDQLNRLGTITDDRGFAWELLYDDNGRVIELVDHVWETAGRSARSVKYDYDAIGNLVAVFLPETARYNDASSNRVTWKYAYDNANRLADVYAPNEAYTGGTSVKSFTWEVAGDRVVGFRDGHASGTHQLRYTRTAEGAPLVRHITPTRTRVDYELDVLGRAVKVGRYTGFWDVSHATPIDHAAVACVAPRLRPADPANFVTLNEYNEAHEVTAITRPDGSRERFAFPCPRPLTFGSCSSISGSTLTSGHAAWQPNEFAGSFLRLGNGFGGYGYYEIAGNQAGSITVVSTDLELLDWSSGAYFAVYSENPDPLAAGNLLEHRRVSSDGQQSDLVRSWTYEPYFQQVRSATCERGFTTSWEFGFDVGGNPKASCAGNITKRTSPTVTVIQPDGATSPARYETEYSYNSYGQLIGVVDAEGGVEVRKYYGSGDQTGFLERVVRGYGALDLTQVFEYDKTGLLTGQYQPGAFAQGSDTEDFKTTRRVNELGQVWHEQGPRYQGKRIDTYRYFDATGNEVAVWREYVTAAGDVPPAPSNEHDPATFNRSAAEMEATWVQTSRTFDLAGRLLTETLDAKAGAPVLTVTWKNEYDELGNLAARVSPLGNTTAYEYDERCLLWKHTVGKGTEDETTRETDYDRNGRVACRRTQLGNETVYGFDGHGRLSRVTDPESHYCQYETDAAGNVVAESLHDSADELLVKTEWLFDELDRRCVQTVLALDAAGSEIESGARITRFTLNGRGETVKRDEGNGKTCVFTYDKSARLVDEIDPFGNHVKLTLNPDGRVTRRDFDDYNAKTGNTECAASEADYNTLGLPARIRDRRHQSGDFNTEVTHKWDGWGRLVETVDASGASVRRSYDLRSLPTETRKSAGSGPVEVWQEKWDDDGRCFGVDVWDDASGATLRSTTHEYDALGRLILTTNPDGSMRSFAWNKDSHLVAWTDETGCCVRQHHDGNGRVTVREIDPTFGTDRETFEYDGAGRLVKAESFAKGMTLSRVSWAWNTLGRAEGYVIEIGDGGDGVIGSWATTCEYDVHGAVRAYGYSDGNELRFTRDVLSRISAIHNGSATLAAFDWAGKQRVTSVELGNGLGVSFAYEAGYSRLIEDIHHKRGEESLWRVERRYNVRGLPVRERREHQGATGRATVFDALSRMTTHYMGADLADSAFEGGALPADFGIARCFNLDFRGNRSGDNGIADQSPMSEIYATSYVVSDDGVNRYTSVDGASRVHDERGRTTNDYLRGLEYRWGFRDRLVGVASPQAPTAIAHAMCYDATGRCVLEDDVFESLPRRRTVLISAPDGTPLEEIVLDSGNEEIVRIQYAPGPLGVVAERVASSWRYHHRDQDGSLIGLTDEGGRRLAEFDYLPFGEPVRTDFLLDVSPAQVSYVSADLPSEGITRIAISVPLTTDVLAGHELALFVPGTTSDRYRSGAVVSNTAATIDVDDPDGLIHNALQLLGSGFFVLEARLSTGTPSCSYDAHTHTTRLVVSDSDFSRELIGGWLVPNVRRPSYLQIIDVDSSGNWVKVRGDATSAFGSGANYRVLPPVRESDYGPNGDPGARLLWRGMRYSCVKCLSGSMDTPTAGRGWYCDNGRMFDPNVGRYISPGETRLNPYAWYEFESHPVVHLPGGTSSSAPRGPASVPALPEFRCDVRARGDWFE